MKNTLSAVYRREIKATDLKQVRRGKTSAPVFRLFKISFYKSIVNFKMKLNLNVSIIYKTNTLHFLCFCAVVDHSMPRRTRRNENSG